MTRLLREGLFVFRDYRLLRMRLGLRWFKHMTDSLDDPFIQDLMDRFSHLGYAVWFGLIEIIAKENKNSVTGKLSISPTYLRRKLRTSPAKLREVFDYCQTSGKLLVNFSENNWDFNFPKIAEIKDNYTKDLQASGKKLAPYKEEEVEKEVEKRKKKKKKPPISYEDFIQALKASPAYQGVDIDKELAKMDLWLIGPKGKGRKKTHGFITSWLDKAEREFPPQILRPPPEEACTRCGTTNWTSLKNIDKERLCEKCLRPAKQEGTTVRNGSGAVQPGGDTP